MSPAAFYNGKGLFYRLTHLIKFFFFFFQGNGNLLFFSCAHKKLFKMLISDWLSCHSLIKRLCLFWFVPQNKAEIFICKNPVRLTEILFCNFREFVYVSDCSHRTLYLFLLYHNLKGKFIFSDIRCKAEPAFYAVSLFHSCSVHTIRQADCSS